MKKVLTRILLVTLVVLVSGSAARAANTIVRFDTSLGVFNVELYDDDAPITVANFLAYVNGDLYENSFIHRSVPLPAPGFVIQGGGFTYDQPQVEATDFPSIPTFAPIVNESSPLISNLRGTIAMARTSDPNSATSQFFINLSDNSAYLDKSDVNDGYAVFGEVTGLGMAVVDAIAGVPIYNFTNFTTGEPTFSELPLRNYSNAEYQAYVPVDDDNMVLVDISVFVPGDTNGDYIVDNADYDNLIAQFGSSPGGESADFNGDGFVDLEDFSILRGNFGYGVGAAPYADLTAATPEPATLTLLALSGLAIMRRPKRGEFQVQVPGHNI